MKKKFLYILTLTALICSCVKEIPAPAPVNPEDEIGVERDGKVTLGFNVDLGENMTIGTKALDETPDIKNIYVAVFDATGYKLSEYVKANPITPATTNEDKYQFTIQLKVSDKPRTLHFIANGPEVLRFGTEQEVIGELYSMYNADESDEYSRKDAYWQRLEFTKIAPRPEGADDGSKDWQDYNAMVTKLSDLKLIRNFSKVTLSKADAVTNFVIQGMWFVNYPDRGSIAPYNRNTGKFGTDLSDLPGGTKRTKNYLDYDNMAGIEDPKQGNYQGFTLASTNFITPESFTEGNMIAVAADGTVSGYVYEREKALTSPMYLIVKGLFNGSSTPSYYKIAMQDQNGNHYAMLRNFNYNVQILGVSSAGYSSAADALAGVPAGDISMNIDFKDLPNISDGNARLTVNATKLFIIPSDGNKGSVEILYKYEPDITNHANTGIGNELVIEDPANPVKNRPYVTITQDASGSTGDVIESLAYEYCYYNSTDSKYYKVTINETGTKTSTLISDSEFDGNGHIIINSTEAGATPKTQSITITGKKWADGRYRTITRTIQLVLRDALELSLSASPNTGTYTDDTDPEHPTYNAAYVLGQTGQPVVVHIGIDQDLPSSMFPLYFKVSPHAKSLTPDNDYADVQELPVRYGTDATNHPTYWFEKAISWTEYEGNTNIVNGKKQFDVYFKTILADNQTLIDINNDYFSPGTVAVRNYTPATFSSLAFNGSTHKVAQPENFSYTMSAVPADGKVTIAMKGIEPASMTGFTFLGKDSEGYWIYEREVSGTSDEFSVVPYQGGTVSIKLSAYLFTDATASVTAIDPDIPVLYINADGSGSGTKLVSFTSTDVNSGNLVVGQKVTLSFYVLSTAVSSGDVVSITDNGGTSYTATKATETGSPIDVKGNTFNKYTVTYTVPAGSEGISKGYDNQFKVYFKIGSAAPAVKGSFTLPVYGIELGTKLTSVSFDTGKYYVIQNNSTNRYLYNKESTTNASQILRNTWDFSSLVRFGNTTSTSNVSFVKVSTNNQYYLGSSAYNNIALSTTSYAWTITDTFRFSRYRNTSYGYYYAYDNSGSVAMSYSSTTDATRYWNIYPVTFVAPAP